MSRNASNHELGTPRLYQENGVIGEKSPLLVTENVSLVWTEDQSRKKFRFNTDLPEYCRRVLRCDFWVREFVRPHKLIKLCYTRSNLLKNGTQ